ALRDVGTCVVSIDHLANIRHPAQLVVNPLLGPSKEAYEHDTNTQLLLGARYALVRSEIRRVRPARAQEPPPPFAGLIVLPDTDPEFRPAEMIKLLLSVPKLERVDVIARPEHPALEPLQALAEANPDRIKIAVESAEVAARVARCHFAITGGTGFSLE